MLRELFELLTNKTDEVLKIKEITLSDKIGGKRMLLQRIKKGDFPNIFTIDEEVIWNPFKTCVDKNLYNYRELGRKNKSLTNIFAVLKEDVKGVDVFTNVSAIRFKRIIPCGSAEHKQIKELVKNYYNH